MQETMDEIEQEKEEQITALAKDREDLKQKIAESLKEKVKMEKAVKSMQDTMDEIQQEKDEEISNLAKEKEDFK